MQYSTAPASNFASLDSLELDRLHAHLRCGPTPVTLQTPATSECCCYAQSRNLVSASPRLGHFKLPALAFVHTCCRVDGWSRCLALAARCNVWSCRRAGRRTRGWTSPRRCPTSAPGWWTRRRWWLRCPACPRSTPTLGAHCQITPCQCDQPTAHQCCCCRTCDNHLASITRRALAIASVSVRECDS